MDHPVSSFAVHPKLAQLFKQNAQPVPFGTDKDHAYDQEEDVEVARAATLTTDDSGAAMPHDEMPAYEYEEVGFGGGDDFRPSTTSGGEGFSGNESNVLPDELELTFQEDAGQTGTPTASPTRAGSKNTPSSARRSSGAVLATSSDGEKWHPQTIKMMKLLREKITETPVITYQELAEGQRKTIVAKAFFEVLQLTTRGMIQVAQSQPYGEIQISAGAKYDNLLPGESA
jgi:hypothetical protein